MQNGKGGGSAPFPQQLPPLTRSLGNVAPSQANVREFPIRQGSQLASRLTGAMPLAKAGKNDRKKHDATSTISQPKRKGAANWQREKWATCRLVAEFGRKPATGRPWRRRGHLQRTRPKTNPHGLGPAMLNEHGTDGERLQVVRIYSRAALIDPKRGMMLRPNCRELD